MLAAIAMVVAATLPAVPARADAEFPFGMMMNLEVAPQPGSKRLPNLEIGDNGEAILELWCKGGKGQFSVAGNTVIFVAGPMAVSYTHLDVYKRQGECRAGVVHRLPSPEEWLQRPEKMGELGDLD